ncbi:hypothetical protein MKW98_013970 [Papaver atlanticum]|uniref:Uncharacterized protein n=1 Tax=Papaver atlanticum TaxID=357466 RepID=A0AAD4SJM9_9MAGN|nr:hypothetical protein MKW98_013970 [Papaver atlanticum]
MGAPVMMCSEDGILASSEQGEIRLRTSLESSEDICNTIIISNADFKGNSKMKISWVRFKLLPDDANPSDSNVVNACVNIGLKKPLFRGILAKTAAGYVH